MSGAVCFWHIITSLSQQYSKNMYYYHLWIDSSAPKGLFLSPRFVLKPTKGSLKIRVKFYFPFNESFSCLKEKKSSVLQSNNLYVWSRVKQNKKTAKHFEILLSDLVKELCMHQNCSCSVFNILEVVICLEEYHGFTA